MISKGRYPRVIALGEYTPIIKDAEIVKAVNVCPTGYRMSGYFKTNDSKAYGDDSATGKYIHHTRGMTIFVKEGDEPDRVSFYGTDRPMTDAEQVDKWRAGGKESHIRSYYDFDESKWGTVQNKQEIMASYDTKRNDKIKKMQKGSSILENFVEIMDNNTYHVFVHVPNKNNTITQVNKALREMDSTHTHINLFGDTNLGSELTKLPEYIKDEHQQNHLTDTNLPYHTIFANSKSDGRDYKKVNEPAKMTSAKDPVMHGMAIYLKTQADVLDMSHGGGWVVLRSNKPDEIVALLSDHKAFGFDFDISKLRVLKGVLKPETQRPSPEPDLPNVVSTDTKKD